MSDHHVICRHCGVGINYRCDCDEPEDAEIAVLRERAEKAEAKTAEDHIELERRWNGWSAEKAEVFRLRKAIEAASAEITVLRERADAQEGCGSDNRQAGHNAATAPDAGRTPGTDETKPGLDEDDAGCPCLCHTP